MSFGDIVGRAEYAALRWQKRGQRCLLFGVALKGEVPHQRLKMAA
jgi:hypothetical protein